MSDEAEETQALLLEIAERQRELAQDAPRRRFWRQARWRFQASIALLLLAFCVRARIETVTRSWALLRDEAPLRALAAHATTIPWRRLAGIGPGGAKCDLWVSGLGLAQLQCGEEVVYRGFGLLDAGGVYRELTWPDAPSLRALREAPDLFAGEEWERTPLPLDETANRAAIESTFAARQAELAACGHGEAQFQLRVDRDGKVLWARVELAAGIAAAGGGGTAASASAKAPAPPSELERCAMETVTRWRFHRLTGSAPVSVVHRLQF